MSLKRADRLGRYEIVGRLGAEGMGEVYRARDTKLGREVAIKVLPADFASEPERIARFEREARVLAGLNHPGIATLHGFEEAALDEVGESISFLVMEVVEGEDLAVRLRRGPLALDEALPLFAKIADGLDAAHEQGVVHRDLKPANLIVGNDGRVKILDFGIAKALAPASDAGSNDRDLPTLTASPTRHGEILGTAPYMSPEQARGAPVDRRTDIWSFGCVLYEALCGRRPFGGQRVTDLTASILKEDPDWTLLPVDTPPSIRTLLRRTLTKDARQRLRDIGDARLEIEAALLEPADGDEGPTKIGLSREIAATASLMGAFLLVLGFLAGRGLRPGEDVAPRIQHSRWALESGLRLYGGHPSENQNPNAAQRPTRTSMVLSPDGSRLIFAATDGKTARLYRRDLDDPIATPIAGTEGAGSPFISPDGQWLGFVRAAGDSDARYSYSLMRQPWDGGSSSILVDVAEPGPQGAPYGISWGRDVIVWGGSKELWMVSSAGGKPSVWARPDADADQTALRLPHFLPDGETLLYTASRGQDWPRSEIWARKFAGGDPVHIVSAAADARYSPTGHLLFGREGRLMAAPFDLGDLELTGDPVTVLEGVHQAQYAYSTQRDTGAAQFALSHGFGGVGTLAGSDFDPGRCPAAGGPAHGLLHHQRRPG